MIGLVALLLIFFLPGFFLVLILFPRRGQLSRDFDILFKSALGIALSILLSVLVVIILDQIGSSTGTSMITSASLWISIGILTIILGVLSWFFGGLKDLVYSILKKPLAAKESPDDEIRRLAYSKKKLQQKLVLLESDDYQSDPSLREESKVRIPLIKQQIADINTKIDEILSHKEEKK